MPNHSKSSLSIASLKQNTPKNKRPIRRIRSWLGAQFSTSKNVRVENCVVVVVVVVP